MGRSISACNFVLDWFHRASNKDQQRSLDPRYGPHDFSMPHLRECPPRSNFEFGELALTGIFPAGAMSPLSAGRCSL